MLWCDRLGIPQAVGHLISDERQAAAARAQPLQGDGCQDAAAVGAGRCCAQGVGAKGHCAGHVVNDRAERIGGATTAAKKRTCLHIRHRHGCRCKGQGELERAQVGGVGDDNIDRDAAAHSRGSHHGLDAYPHHIGRCGRGRRNACRGETGPEDCNHQHQTASQQQG